MLSGTGAALVFILTVALAEAGTAFLTSDYLAQSNSTVLCLFNTVQQP